MPFVGASSGELVGDFDLFTGEDVDDKAAGLADFGVAGRGGHDAEGHQWRAHGDAVERLAGEADRFALQVRGDHGDAGGVVPERFAKVQGLDGSTGK